MLKVIDFTVEYLHDGVVDEKLPRFSWKLQSDKNDVYQTAYSLSVNGLDTGKVESAESIFVDVLKTPLAPATEYVAKLTVYDNHGENATAELKFETALLDSGFKTAEFIAPDVEQSPNSSVVFSNIHLNKKPRKARAYVSALGMYTLQINGKRAGDLFFAPFWTDYKHTLEYQTYDITSLLKEGDNLIEITLAKGWYRSRLGDYGKDVFGDTLAAIAEIRIDGDTFVTDKTWSACESVVVDSEIYDGETRDYTRGFIQVYSVKTVEYDKSRLIGQINEPCRITQRIKPVRKIITPKGEQVLDFGQNLVGVVECEIDGKSGQEVTIRHAEVLDEEGNFYTENLRSAKSTDTFILKGGKQKLNAEFTFHGFRYAQIIGADADAEHFTALVIHSDMPETGTVQTSDKDINRLMENIKWTQRGNFVDVPTDCPQRDERLGWTGDISVFSETAVLQYNTALFFKKWLKDMRNNQPQDGSVPTIIPSPAPVAGTSAIWSDCITIVPWAVFCEYGDKRILEEHFDAMYKYVYKLRTLQNDKGLVKNGHQFGDWLAMDADAAVDVNRGATDQYFVANAYYCESIRITAEAAKILGKNDIYNELSKECEKIISAMREEYFTATGRLVSETQTACTLALKFGIVPDKFRDKITQTLKALVEKRKNHLSTGFAATRHLLPTLTENGLFEQAEKIFLNCDCPGWLYEVKNGATTVWERWNGIQPDGRLFAPAMNSFNHYAHASVGAFVFRKVAGVEIAEAGYKRFAVCSHPLKGVDSLNAKIDTSYGAIESGYEIKDGKLNISVTVPVNTTAEIILPNGERQSVGSGSHKFECDASAFVNTDKFTLDNKVGDVLQDEKAKAAALQIAPEIFAGDSIKMIAGLSFVQLCNMSGNGMAERVKEILKQINERLK